MMSPNPLPKSTISKGSRLKMGGQISANSMLVGAGSNWQSIPQATPNINPNYMGAK
jgi:hypothetical protein